jgi:hypothetical protein
MEMPTFEELAVAVLSLIVVGYALREALRDP